MTAPTGTDASAITSGRRIVVMGVAGSGKSTIGGALAAALDLPFVDADALHPAVNLAKMAAGHPLDDRDRAPWLAAVAAELSGRTGVVMACSALKRRYRDRLRVGDVRFVHLALGADVARRRTEHRVGHFMGAGMVAGQFAALERPDPAETDVVTVDATGGIDQVVAAALAGLRAR